MDACKEQFVAPIRDRLNELGYHAVIVQDEPSLRGSFDLESKVDKYIEAADAFIALCTDDDRNPGKIAQNIIDEIGRARAHPKLREVVCVLKEPQVGLPSNIYPAWEPIDHTRPDEALSLIRRQLNAWDITLTTPSASPTLTEPLPDQFLQRLFHGVGIGDHEIAEQRLRQLFSVSAKTDQRRVAKGIFEYVMSVSEGNDDAVHVSTSFLEGIARIDNALVPIDWVEQLAGSAVVQHRMSAATQLWDLAETVPGMVPIDLVIKLAKPATEDWYVYSPAITAAKQLALTRRSALEILLELGRSTDAGNRLAAVEALTDLARVNAALIPLRPVRQLCAAEDESVSDAAQKLLPVIENVPEKDRGNAFRGFAL
jgi:hypothetical protein